MNPTNVRRNDHSGSSSCNSSFRKSEKEKPKVNVAKKKLSCAEQMALESPMASPQMTKKASENCQRKISAPANLENCQSNQQVKSKKLRDIPLSDILSNCQKLDKIENGYNLTKKMLKLTKLMTD